jgi:tRNA threonylcarbamoyladenosine biosynthesis protein TsaB
MRILAVDTATPCCSVALAENGEVGAAAVDASGVTHSRHLMGLIHGVMASSGWRVDQLDGFAVTRGPGSFTGIRIGMSAVMGLAQAVARPVVGISVLEALAWPLSQSGKTVCALIDARRGEVYCGVYRWEGNAIETLVPEQVAAPKSVLEMVQGECLFVGSGATLYQDRILAAKGAGARFAPSFQQRPDAAVVAWLAEARLTTEGGDAADLRPIYLRKSDAQIHRETAVNPGPGSSAG